MRITLDYYGTLSSNLALNSGAFKATFSSNTNFFAQSEGRSNESKVSDHPPVITSVDVQSKILELVLVIQPGYSFVEQIEIINQWFNTHDPALYFLVWKNPDDANRKWYVKCRPESQPSVEVGRVVISLRVPDPIAKTVLASTDSWAITATGQTKNVTTLGNRAARPVISITPTIAKTGGSGSHEFRIWRNPIARMYEQETLDIVDASWNTLALISDTTVSNQINNGAGYGADDLSLAIDTPVGGGLPIGSGMCYVVSTGEQIRYSGISGGVMTVIADGRGWGGTSAAAIANNAVLAQSLMVADGRDIRVYRNERKAAYWLSGIKTANTKLWTPCSYSAPVTTTLNEAIVGTDNLSYIEVKLIDLLKLDKLDKKGSKIVAIDSEIFTFTAVDRTTRRLTGIKRGAFGSTKVGHLKNATIHWIEHVYKIAYNSADASSPTDSSIGTSEDQRPIWDMDNSTNTSRRYLVFYDETGLRSGSFKLLVKSGKAKCYSGSHGATADPATELGLSGLVFDQGGVPRGNSYSLRSLLYHPAGFTTITCNGALYRYESDWATLAGLVQGDTPMAMTSVFSEDSPMASKTWEAWAETAVALTKRYIAFQLKGNVSGKANNVHHFEVQTITTLGINSANVPQLVFASARIGACELDARITNTTLGIHINVERVMELNETLEIDCDSLVTTYLKDNTPSDRSVTYNKRSEMFLLAAGAGTLKYDDTGTNGVTIGLSWHDRMA